MNKKYDKIMGKVKKIVNEKNKMNEQIKDIALRAISSKNPKLICLAAINFEDEIDDKLILKMAEALNEIGNANYIYEFASQVKKAPLDVLAKGIIASKDTDYIEMFAKIKGAPVYTLAKAVIKLGNAQAIYNFAYYVSWAPKEKLSKAILKIGSKESWEAYALDIMHMPTEQFIKEYSNFSYDDESELE